MPHYTRIRCGRERMNAPGMEHVGISLLLASCIPAKRYTIHTHRQRASSSSGVCDTLTHWLTSLSLLCPTPLPWEFMCWEGLGGCCLEAGQLLCCFARVGLEFQTTPKIHLEHIQMQAPLNTWNQVFFFYLKWEISCLSRKTGIGIWISNLSSAAQFIS